VNIILLMSSFNELLYAFGSIVVLSLSLSFCMYTVGYLTPMEIIRNTLDRIKDEEKYYPYISYGLRLIAGPIALIGLIIAIFDPRGFYFISYALMSFGFAFTLIQVYENSTFIRAVQKRIGISNDGPIIIKDRISIEKTLLIARIIFIISCCVVFCGFGIFIMNFSNSAEVFRAFDLLGIAISMLLFAGIVELASIDFVDHEAILKRLDLCKY
jgi:hypothetical protein